MIVRCWFSANEFPDYEFVQNVVGVLCIVAILAILAGLLRFILGTVGVGKFVGCEVGLTLADWWMR